MAGRWERFRSSSNDGRVEGDWLLRGKSMFFPFFLPIAYIFSCFGKYSSWKMRLIGTFHMANKSSPSVRNFCCYEATSFWFAKSSIAIIHFDSWNQDIFNGYSFIQGIQYRYTYEIESGSNREVWKTIKHILSSLPSVRCASCPRILDMGSEPFQKTYDSIANEWITRCNF